jgi:hypothetical protein
LPMVGKWFSKRWMCVKSIVILKPDAAQHPFKDPQRMHAPPPIDHYNT